jgi:DNA-3-methyladenine glycosylase II
MVGGAMNSDIITSDKDVATGTAWLVKNAPGIRDADTVLKAGEEGLRTAGLSRPKIRYALALAEADLDYPALRAAPDAEVIETLTAVTGIGVWTAQIYAMFSLGRADVFAPGDLALQEAVKLLFDLPERPSAKELEARAQSWAPWRAVAARGLFAYYRVAKQREGLT